MWSGRASFPNIQLYQNVASSAPYKQSNPQHSLSFGWYFPRVPIRLRMPTPPPVARDSQVLDVKGRRGGRILEPSQGSEHLVEVMLTPLRCFQITEIIIGIVRLKLLT